MTGFGRVATCRSAIHAAKSARFESGPRPSAALIFSRCASVNARLPARSSETRPGGIRRTLANALRENRGLRVQRSSQARRSNAFGDVAWLLTEVGTDIQWLAL